MRSPTLLPQTLTPTSLLWRYFTLEKFLDLIVTRQLHFSNPSHFHDPWEHYPPRSLTNIDLWLEPLRRWQPVYSNDEIQNAARNLAGQLAESYNRRDDYLISCWNEDSEDNAGLWDLYANRSTGIAVRSSVERLYHSITASAERRRMYIGRVKYVDFNDENSLPLYEENLFGYQNGRVSLFSAYDHILPCLYKRKAFAHEKEVRSFMYYPSHLGKLERTKVSVDLNVLIDEIIIAPMARPWFQSLAYDLLRSLGVHLTITGSNIYKNPDPTQLGSDYEVKASNLACVHMEHHKDNSLHYLMFKNMEEYVAWAKYVSELLGFPHFGRWSHTGGIAVSGTPTIRWSDPIPHPCPGKSEVIASATPRIAEGRSLLTREECEALGWFGPEDT